MRTLFVLFGFLVTTNVLALAGIAESSSYFHYNRYTDVELGHPSDLCQGPTKWCLGLKRQNFQRFKGIDSTFEELNVPDDPASPYLIGRRSSDNAWLVYDLDKEEVLLEHENFQMVLSFWYELGMTSPTFVDAHNTRAFLEETRDSVKF